MSQQLSTKVFSNMPSVHDLGLTDGNKQITISVHLKGSNEEAFDKAIDALYDPQSPMYHKWMSDGELRKYAPSTAQIEVVKKELERNGIGVVSIDPLGFSIRASGSSAKLQTAFQTPLHDFEHNGRTFRSNLQPAQLTGEAGKYVASIAGLESHAVHPMFKQASNLLTGQPLAPIAIKNLTSTQLSALITDTCLTAPSTKTLQTTGASLPVGVYYGPTYLTGLTKACAFTASQLQQVYGLDQVYKAGFDGKGQTIVLFEGFGYPQMQADANTFSTLMSLPQLDSTNFSVVYPEGMPDPKAVYLTGWSTEIALDIDWAHSMAPGAKIVVVAVNGQDNEDFQFALSYASNHHLGNSFSNSWETDTDIVSGPLEQASYERVLKVAAARGTSVNFSSGDNGDGGLGDPLGAAGVPSDAPHATAIGGTTILNQISGTGFDYHGWGTKAVAFRILVQYSTHPLLSDLRAVPAAAKAPTLPNLPGRQGFRAPGGRPLTCRLSAIRLPAYRSSLPLQLVYSNCTPLLGEPV